MGYYIQAGSNVSIYVEDINPGSDKAILFLHGWPANHQMFEYQFNYLPQMGYRCIGWDQRGFGKSDKPWGGYDYDQIADDLRAVIEALQLQNITLAGHSTGGAIAIRYMARHSGFGVTKLVLISAAAPSLIQRPYFPYGLKKEEVVKIINDTYNDRPNMLRGFGDLFFFQHVTQGFSDWFFQLGLQAASWATAAVAKAWLNEEKLFYDLAQIQVPTLILHGIHDQVCRFPLAEAQRQGIKNSKLIPLQNSGHGAFWEERDKLNRELVQFIG
ncbi:alpha/beta fold hydrolase [Bacillus sp. USDA818B3_A]|uniref:alpha/beta fold hydrolase n=1 Tax=Bacillus sp. USDA818B3_A TaxID=2698834 RepID=UPI00136955DA|nr:alpha/beta hydrolase [Bacillus sp. USDA818B3_A]